MLIEILKAVLFGIVEGITEWLPISSTGHMILVDQFVHLNVSADFYKMFEVVIQLGAIMAVVVLFWNKIHFQKLIASYSIPINIKIQAFITISQFFVPKPNKVFRLNTFFLPCHCYYIFCYLYKDNIFF